MCACGVPEQVKTNLGVKRTVPLTRKSLEWAIILCHDHHKPTLDALDEMIPWLLEQGYDLVTVSELLNSQPGGMQPGQVYYKKTVDE